MIIVKSALDIINIISYSKSIFLHHTIIFVGQISAPCFVWLVNENKYSSYILISVQY
jgi:hypothetical protein